MGDLNYDNIQRGALKYTDGNDQEFMFMTQRYLLKWHVLESASGREYYISYCYPILNWSKYTKHWPATIIRTHRVLEETTRGKTIQI